MSIKKRKDNKQNKIGYGKRLKQRVAAFFLTGVVAIGGFFGIKKANDVAKPNVNPDRGSSYSDEVDSSHSNHNNEDLFIIEGDLQQEETKDIIEENEINKEEEQQVSSRQEEIDINKVIKEEVSNVTVNNDKKDTINVSNKIEEDIPSVSHVHEFSAWADVDDVEQRTCVCGEVETRLHEYKEVNKEIIANSDSTHTIRETLECTVCGHEKVNDVVEACQFGDSVYQEASNKDEAVCSLCGNKEEKDHEHQYGDIISFDDTYEVHKCVCGDELVTTHVIGKNINGDGTVTYVCLHDGCGYSKTASIGDAPVAPGQDDPQGAIDPNERGDWGVDIPGEPTKPTNPSKPSNPNTPSNPSTPSTPSQGVPGTNHGGNTGSHNTPEKHHHDYKLSSYDDTYEHFTCTCGETLTNKHNIKETVDENGYKYECLNDYCNYEKVHTHEYKLNSTDSENEYWDCSCGNNKVIAHNLQEDILDDGSIKYTCQNNGCGYSYTKEPTHEHDYSTFMGYDDAGETYACACGETIRKEHKFGNKHLERTSDGGYIYVEECLNPNCDCKRITEHVHLYGEPHMAGADQNYDWVQDCEDKDCDAKVVTPHDTKHVYTVESYDENNETIECVCGITVNRAHDWSFGKKLPSGEYYQECQNDGCSATRTYHSCDEKEEDIIYLNSDEGCQKIIYKCSVCHKVQREEITPHEVVVVKWKKIKKCSRPKCSWTQALEEDNEYEIRNDVFSQKVDIENYSQFSLENSQISDSNSYGRKLVRKNDSRNGAL